MNEFEMEKLSSSDSQGHVQRHIKILLVGELATGKTSIIKRYLKNGFSESYKTTFGVDYSDIEIEWNESTTLNLQFWDINGYERFNGITHIYYRESSAAIIVFDVIRKQTLEIARCWKNDIDQKVFTSTKKHIPCLLLGNKIDFYKDERWYKTKDEMNRFVSENNFIGFFEVSAKSGKNVNESIEFLIKYIMENNIKPFVGTNDESDIKIHNNSNEKSGRCILA